MNDKLAKYIEERLNEFDLISDVRQNELKELSGYILKKEATAIVELIFICTHNSRRSHMSQIWAQIAAHRYGIANIKTYSGGTEATAFNPRAVKAMQEAGIEIQKMDESQNPKYNVAYSSDAEKIIAFSKKYSDDFNPQKGFCAVMTCSDADEACPVVFGAEARITLPYEDPKKYDDTDQEELKYAERSMQIAREMFFVFSQVKEINKQD